MGTATAASWLAWCMEVALSCGVAADWVSMHSSGHKNFADRHTLEKLYRLKCIQPLEIILNTSLWFNRPKTAKLDLRESATSLTFHHSPSQAVRDTFAWCLSLMYYNPPCLSSALLHKTQKVGGRSSAKNIGVEQDFNWKCCWLAVSLKILFLTQILLSGARMCVWVC